MVRLIDDPDLRNRHAVFRDRKDAGKRLAGFVVVHFSLDNPLVCAIPAGGVPVGFELALGLNARMFLGIVRKLKVPWNPEAGFGSMTWEGQIFLNQELVRSLSLTEQEINRAVADTKENIRKRMELYAKDNRMPTLRGRSVILTDDGLASGYTMIAAIETVRKSGPEKILVAVPTGSSGSVAAIAGRVDAVICLNLVEGYPFAVAEAYQDWYDLTDEEVIGILAEAKRIQLL